MGYDDDTKPNSVLPLKYTNFYVMFSYIKHLSYDIRSLPLPKIIMMRNDNLLTFWIGYLCPMLRQFFFLRISTQRGKREKRQQLCLVSFISFRL